MTGIREIVIERRRLRAEVERLRAAIEEHKGVLTQISNPATVKYRNEILWAVLDD